MQTEGKGMIEVMKKGIIFDLDGTLWDSSQGVADSWQDSLEKHFDIEKVITAGMIQGVMGKSMYEISDILFSEFEMKKRRELLSYCCEQENEYIRTHGGILMDGLEEVLEQLKASGYHLSIVSNCQEGYIEAFLEYHKLGGYFDDFECFGRTGREKGRNIRLVVERSQLDQAVYIGDVQGDYYAAQEAGVPFIHAKNGYGTIREEVPYITGLSQIPKVVEDVFAKGKEANGSQMEKIASFTIDHIKLEPGIYVSRKDEVGHEVITTFDLRMTSPNDEPVMNTAEVHTIEHLAATYLRNEPVYGDKVIYFGPMGCRTGFYLLLAGDYESRDIVKLITDLFEFIRDFEGEVPGASPRDCGNYLDMNLGMAKDLAGRYLQNTLYGINTKHLVYPEPNTSR